MIKKMFFDTKIKYYNKIITYQNIDDFINLLIEDVNDISYCLFGTQYTFIYKEFDEVNIIKKIFEERIKND